MSSVRTKLAITAVATGALVTTASGTAYAAGVSPANTTVIATSGQVKISLVTLGAVLVITCPISTIQFTTPSSGYGPVTISPNPTFGNCVDVYGGSAAVSAGGMWQLTAVAGPTSVRIGIPAGGLTIVDPSMLKDCVLTALNMTITGSYSNSTGQVTFSRAPLSLTSPVCGVWPSAYLDAVYWTSPHLTIT
ncbi:hypothetical protein [Actinoallomurus sp. NPDC052274]|uniref:hypothetical protein n=1 Tax=Actinoallomurus sp. NPDC052274 TaxID=3155420 RepID=UPI003428CFA7